MDVNIFTEMLRGLNTRDDSIKSTADYCWRNRVSAEDFIKVTEKEMMAAKKENKRYFFYVLHELLKMSSTEKPYVYVKLIGSKIKGLVQDFAKSVDNYS
jgi:dihydroxyacetone kinase-like predicted kinase